MTEKDLAHYRAFKKVINKGDFNIKGDATIAVALLFKWFDELENKIECLVSQPVMSEPIKEIEGDTNG